MWYILTHRPCTYIFRASCSVHVIQHIWFCFIIKEDTLATAAHSASLYFALSIRSPYSTVICCQIYLPIDLITLFFICFLVRAHSSSMYVYFEGKLQRECGTVNMGLLHCFMRIRVSLRCIQRARALPGRFEAHIRRDLLPKLSAYRFELPLFHLFSSMCSLIVHVRIFWGQVAACMWYAYTVNMVHAASLF